MSIADDIAYERRLRQLEMLTEEDLIVPALVLAAVGVIIGLYMVGTPTWGYGVSAGPVDCGPVLLHLNRLDLMWFDDKTPCGAPLARRGVTGLAILLPSLMMCLNIAVRSLLRRRTSRSSS